MPTYCNYYKISNCIIKVVSSKSLYYTFNDNIEQFRYPYDDKVDITINHLFHKPPINSIFKYITIIDNENWTIKKSDNNIAYHYKPYDIKAICDKTYTNWDIYIPKEFELHYNEGCMRDLAIFYSDQIILYPYLLKNNGLILHGNTLCKDDKSILLIGKSGSGKSTLSKMLELDGWNLLCDDRTILMDNKLYGGWFYGSYNKTNNLSCSIDKVCTLTKSDGSYIVNETTTLGNFYSNIVDHVDLDVSHIIKVYNSLSIGKDNNMIYNIHFNLSGDIVNIINAL